MRARCAGILGATLLLSTGFILSANSQTPPAGGLNAARQAVDERKAVYKLIGASFKPIGNVLKGSTQYDAATIQKSIDRVVFLSGLLDEAFPENSNLGDPETKAKADIWTNHADFEKKEKNFQTHVDLSLNAAARSTPLGLTFFNIRKGIAQVSSATKMLNSSVFNEIELIR